MAYPPASAPKAPENPTIKLGILILLALGLLFVLIHFNLLSCGFYTPVGCDIYYGIVSGGTPKTLIVYGDEGMGEPQQLFETLKGTRLNAHVNMREIGLVTLPLLSEYQLVIVEKARKMSITQIKMFQEFAARGGRLVWVGDAGTKPAGGETDMNYFLLKGQRKAGESKTEYIGPWARRQGDKQVSLDYTLGVNYRGNYCEMVACRDAEIVGNFEFPATDLRLANGLTQGLAFYGDFSIVQLSESSYQKNVATLNYGTNVIAPAAPGYFWLKAGSQNFGRDFPLIVASGVGGRVAYYAFPPEYVVGERMPIDKKTGQRIAYRAIVENMYYGMLYK